MPLVVGRIALALGLNRTAVADQFSGLLLVALLAVWVGPACEPRQNPGETGGTDAGSPAFSLKVTALRDCPTAPAERKTNTSAPTPSAPRNRMLSLGVEVELTSHSDRAIPANFFYGVVRDSGGREYLPDADGCQPILRAEPLRRGEVARGWISFSLPALATGLRFAYRPRLSSSAQTTEGEWHGLAR
jgi:hypothetical protein